MARKPPLFLLLAALSSVVLSARTHLPDVNTRDGFQQKSTAVEVFVSSGGDDGNNGQSLQSPLRQLETAQRMVRTLRADLPLGTPAKVWVIGYFELRETLNLTALDSNTSWVGLPAANQSGISALPVLSGGSHLKWRSQKKPSGLNTVVTTASAANASSQSRSSCQLLSATLSDDQHSAALAAHGTVFPQLLVDGHRAPVSRDPLAALQDPSSYYEWTTARAQQASNTPPPASGGSRSAFAYDSAAVTPLNWAPADDAGALKDVTAVVFDAPWSAVPQRIQSVNPTTSTVQLVANVSGAPLTSSSFVGTKRWVALNVQAGPLAPGMFRYRTTTQELQYSYCGGANSEVAEEEDVTPAVVEAGENSQQATQNAAARATAAAVAAAATPAAPVPAPARATVGPSSAVVPRLQTLVTIGDGATGISFESIRFSHTATGANPPSYSYGAPMHGALELGEGVSAICIHSCAFTLIGANAVQVGHAVDGVEVGGCIFKDIGGRGFSTTLETTAAKQDARNILLTDSVFDGCGHLFLDQPYCIFVNGEANITVSHCDVSNVPYVTSCDC
jgi:hypothetical protein